MKTAKYLIISEHGMEWAIVFPGCVSHAHAVNKLVVPVVAAGFFSISDDGQIEVEGWSDTLNANSRAQDADIIKQSLAIAGLFGATTVNH